MIPLQCIVGAKQLQSAAPTGKLPNYRLAGILLAGGLIFRYTVWTAEHVIISLWFWGAAVS
jgi:hypothetical protein